MDEISERVFYYDPDMHDFIELPPYLQGITKSEMLYLFRKKQNVL